MGVLGRWRIGLAAGLIAIPVDVALHQYVPSWQARAGRHPDRWARQCNPARRPSAAHRERRNTSWWTRPRRWLAVT